MGADLGEVRRKAWATRRAKYGHPGHAGGYARSTRERLALALIVRLHLECVLSEGQCCQALQMDRVSFRALCDGCVSPNPDVSISDGSTASTEQSNGRSSEPKPSHHMDKT